MAEWCRTWDDIPYTGGANGIRVAPPDGEGWQLFQSVYVPPRPVNIKRKDHEVRLGSMIHMWRRDS